MKRVIVSLLIACTSLCAQDESALRQRIQQLERRGEWERAVAGYETLTKLRPEDFGVARGFARALSASGQHERVVAHLDQWLQKHVDDHMAYLLLGDAHQQMGRSDKAVKTWRRLLKIRPNDAASYQQVSDRCQAAGQTNAAISVLVEGRAALGDAQLFSWELASLHLESRPVYAGGRPAISKALLRGQIGCPSSSTNWGPPVRTMEGLFYKPCRSTHGGTTPYQRRDSCPRALSLLGRPNAA